MANRLAKTILAAYTPAKPAVPARPPFCTTTTVLTGYVKPSDKGYSIGAGLGSISSNSGKTNSRPTDGPQWVYKEPDYANYDLTSGWVQVPNLGGASAISQNNGNQPQSVLVPRYSTTTKCKPGTPSVPGVPSRVDYTQTYSWGSGARSIAEVPLLGAFTATVPDNALAVQLGLTPARFAHAYDHMPHAIVARKGTWTVVERGVEKATGEMAPGAKLEIQRRVPEVVYLVGGEEVYTSTGALSATGVYGAALLYSGLDYVDSPTIRSLSAPLSLEIGVPAPLLLIAETDLAYGKLKLPTWRVEGVMIDVPLAANLRIDVPAPLFIAGDKHRVLARLQLPTPTVRGVLSRQERGVNQLALLVPPPRFGLTMLSGERLTVDHVVPAPRLVGADVPALGFGRLALPGIVRLRATAPYMQPGEIDGLASMVAHDSAYLQAALVILAVDSLEVSEVEATLVIVVELAAMDGLDVQSEATLGTLVQLLAMEQVAVTSNGVAAQQEAIQYAVNVATGALSTYQGFDFRGFARTAGGTYAFRADGLYRIGAQTDDGELISALLDFGADDLGANTVKHVNQAYIGVRTDGQCFVRVKTDDGRERVYRVRNDQNVRRATLAKGVSGRYWSVQLEIVGASFAEVDSVELLIGATQRRGFGARN